MGSAGGDCCHVALPSPWYRTYACDCASDCDIATSNVTVMTTQHVPLEQSVCGPSELSKLMYVCRRTTWHDVSAESPVLAGVTADDNAAEVEPAASPPPVGAVPQAVRTRRDESGNRRRRMEVVLSSRWGTSRRRSGRRSFETECGTRRRRWVEARRR